MDAVDNVIKGFQNFWGFSGAERGKLNESSMRRSPSTSSKLVVSQFNQSRSMENRRFHISKEIGRGKFASVYLACDLHRNEDVAIKMLSKSTMEKHLSSELPAIYSDSERSIVMDGHRNIVQLLESYYDEQETFCMVMEFCPGGNLMQFVQERGRLQEIVAKNFLLQVAIGLSHMHKRGFIHRDIKAANIMLSEKSPRATLKLADFDLCRLLSGNELEMTSCGSPHYMAPEVFQSVGFQVYGFQADVWSLGVLFHVMLLGSVPFTGASVYDLYCNVISSVLPCQPPEGVSEEAWAVIRKLLTINPEQRMTLDELLTVLKTSRPSISTSAPALPGNSFFAQPATNQSADLSMSLVPSSPNPFRYSNKPPNTPSSSILISSQSSPHSHASASLAKVHKSISALLVFATKALEGKVVPSNGGDRAKKEGLVISFLLWLALVGKKIAQSRLNDDADHADKKALLLVLQEIVPEIENLLSSFPQSSCLPPPEQLITCVYEEFIHTSRQNELSALYAFYSTFRELERALGRICSVLGEADQARFSACRGIFDQCREGMDRIRSLGSSKVQQFF